MAGCLNNEATSRTYPMILFKPDSKEKILAGTKWQTRKLWSRPRAKVGSEHLIYLRPPMTGEKPFARILIQRVWQQALGEITAEEAQAEGFDSIEDFLESFRKINGRKIPRELGGVVVYAVEFRLLAKLS